MKNSIYTIASAVFLFASCQIQPKQNIEVAKPNIVYILADDLGYGDLSVYGQTHFQTPNLDKMAAEGMLFTQHYAGTTVCAPSRSSLMTGQHTGTLPSAAIKAGSRKGNGHFQTQLLL
ncbi:hypothetical protein MASR2M47_35160 [Draconibacterium sp.]